MHLDLEDLTLVWKGSGINEKAYDQHGIVRVIIDPKYYRPSEVDLLLGDPTKAIKKLGGKEKYDTLDKVIKDMFQ